MLMSRAASQPTEATPNEDRAKAMKKKKKTFILEVVFK